MHGLLEIAADETSSEIAEAIESVVDMNGPPRARTTALGMALARMPEVEKVDSSRGAAVYRLRTLDE